MRRIALIAASVATLAIAGCGGGDSNQELSYSDFSEATNKVCQDHGPAINELAGKLTGDAANDEAVLDDLVPESKAYIEDLQDPAPPAELEQTVTERNAIINETYGYFVERQKLAAAGDQKAYTAFVKAQASKTQSLGAAALAATSKLGAGDCL